MSKIVGANITCPSCKYIFPTELYRSIWVEEPKNMALVMNNEINTVNCPKCNHIEHLDFPFLCTNVKKGYAIWYEPYHDAQIDKDIIGYKKVMGANSFYATAPRVKNWDDFKKQLKQLDKKSNSPEENVITPWDRFIEQKKNSEKKEIGEGNLSFVHEKLDTVFKDILIPKDVHPKIKDNDDFPFDNYAEVLKSLRSGNANLTFVGLNSAAFNVVSTKLEANISLFYNLIHLIIAPLTLIIGAFITENFWILLVGFTYFLLNIFGTHPFYKNAPKALIILFLIMLYALNTELHSLFFSVFFMFLCITGLSLSRRNYNHIIIGRATTMEKAFMFLIGSGALKLCGERYNILWLPKWLQKL